MSEPISQGEEDFDDGTQDSEVGSLDGKPHCHPWRIFGPSTQAVADSLCRSRRRQRWRFRVRQRHSHYTAETL